MNQTIQEAAESISLPTHEEITDKKYAGLSALEKHIYSFEPAGNEDEQAFRSGLIALVREMFIAGAEWAQLEWVPVTERLPEFNTDVLVLRYNEYSKKYDRLIGRIHPAKEDGQPYGRAPMPGMLGGHRKTYDKFWSLPAIQLLHEIQFWMPMPAIPDSLLNFKP